MLESHLISQKDLKKLVKEAADKALLKNHNNWTIVGKSAWDAVYNYPIPPNYLLPFDVANTAVSSAAWSVTWSPLWSSARSTAWNAAKAIAKKHDRIDAWDAAKTLAWTLSWPKAKNATKGALSFIPRAAAGDISWYAAWLTASEHLEDKANPFASLFNIWELGFYPMLLFDGSYALISINEKHAGTFTLLER